MKNKRIDSGPAKGGALQSSYKNYFFRALLKLEYKHYVYKISVGPGFSARGGYRQKAGSLAFKPLQMLDDFFANLSCPKQIPRKVRGKGLPYNIKKISKRLLFNNFPGQEQTVLPG